MPKVKDLGFDDLEQVIEQKMLEMLGDPDSGLQLKEEFKENLRECFKKQPKRIHYEKVLKEFGQD